MKTQNNWVTIPDNQVRHVWEDPETGAEVTIPPTFYSESGTPIDENTGDDLWYVRTEVCQPDLVIMDLRRYMAQACHYAQEHINDLAAWPSDASDREYLLQCTSYQMACFLAQNTVYGSEGVDWDIVIKELVKHPGKLTEEWEAIIESVAQSMGGWKKVEQPAEANNPKL